MSPGLTSVHIREMSNTRISLRLKHGKQLKHSVHFNEWNLDGQKSIPDSDTSMTVITSQSKPRGLRNHHNVRECCWIDNNGIYLQSCIMNRVDDIAFVIRLKGL